MIQLSNLMATIKSQKNNKSNRIPIIGCRIESLNCRITPKKCSNCDLNTNRSWDLLINAENTVGTIVWWLLISTFSNETVDIGLDLMQLFESHTNKIQHLDTNIKIVIQSNESSQCSSKLNLYNNNHSLQHFGTKMGVSECWVED